jgi:PKD repeat protein
MRASRQRQLCVFILILASATSGLVAQDTIYSDDFQRPDGPPAGWTLYAGTGNITSGRLVTGPTAIEHWFWAGSPAAQVPQNAENVAFDFQMEFLAAGTVAAVGRHGGFQFHCTQATQRLNPNAFSGYFVDWIDRPADRGARLTRVDNGVLVGLLLGAPGSPAEPPLEWRVETDDTNIRVYGDGVLLIEVSDNTYRGGFFGFWAWSGGEQIAWDNLDVTGDVPPVSACFSFNPANPLAGSDVFFDGRCSLSATSIASYSWDFGDGGVASGATAEHTYAFGDNYTVTLTVRDPGGNSDSVSLLVPVGASLLPFSDDFDRAAGPVDGWTPFAGEWNITAAGKLETLAAGAEHWLWAGDPPGVLSGDFVAEFDLEFLTSPADGVGRHAGFMFYAADPTIRWQTTGYFIDWIDRPQDRGIRFTRADGGGVLSELVLGADTSPPEPPLRWRVEVEGPTIRVYGDNILHIEIDDNTYREGHAGFWAYLNNQDILVDNLEIASEIPIDLTACFTTTPVSGRIPLAGKSLRFDGGCSVAPGGAQITAYEWNFGDGMTGNGRTVDHTYAAAGTYPVTLTVRVGASNAVLSRDAVISAGVLQLSDDFNRPDGAVGGWTSAQGDWSILTGTLVTGPTAMEHWIWAGAPPVVGPANATFEFDYLFLGSGTDPVVGRHGGFQFAADRSTQRTGAGAFSGYFVDWIDRPDDVGLRLSRVDRGTLALLGSAGAPQGELPPPLPEPPLIWRVEIDGDHIRIFGDDALYLDVIDGTYRGGFFGFWTWTGNQEVVIDNFQLNGVALTPCFTSSPGRPIAGAPVNFDAGCSEVFGGGSSITSYAWNFGDGGSANGVNANHTYQFPDTYTVTLTVRDSAGGTRSLERLIAVGTTLVPFADCFDRAAGPVDGWTVFQGDWQISDAEQLSIVTTVGGAASEAWIWAGDPPGIMTGDLVLEFEKEYLFDPMDGVGRHAGIMIYASAPTIRWQIDGYTIWWIDRVNDFGIVVMRWDNGALTALNPGTMAAVAQPPLVWRVEVEGPAIRVFGDGALLVEVEDDTYRDGYLGFWAYSNNQDVRFDSLRVGAESLPDCGPSTGTRFIRGDVEQNASHTITDAIRLLSYLFLGQFPEVAGCLDAADVNDNARVDITDPIFLLGALFQGGPQPPPPLTGCGLDPTPDDGIGCTSHLECP